jgi:hypothetical protein
VALVRELTIPTERLPLVGEVSANFCGYRGVAWLVRRIPYGRNLSFLDRDCVYKYIHIYDVGTSHMNDGRRALCSVLCGLVVRVSGYRSRGPSSIPGATRFSEK